MCRKRLIFPKCPQKSELKIINKIMKFGIIFLIWNLVPFLVVLVKMGFKGKIEKLHKSDLRLINVEWYNDTIEHKTPLKSLKKRLKIDINI